MSLPRAQEVALHVGAGGEIEAVTMVGQVQQPGGSPGVLANHFFAAGRLVAGGDGFVNGTLSKRWGCLVVCTPEFGDWHRQAGTPAAPAAAMKVFFCHE